MGFDTLRRFAAVLLQAGRVQLDTDSDEDEYVQMRRFAVGVLHSLDQALGLELFEPATTEGAAPDRPARRSHDPGITLLELLAYAADQLSAYADEVAAEAQLQTRRRVTVAVTVAAGTLVLVAWWRRSRHSRNE